MTTYALYNAAGIITSTNSVQITDPNQIAALTATGLTQIAVPDGTNGTTGMIVGGQYVPNIPAGPPIPSIMVQYIADQINSGNSNISSFHPATITQMNVALTAASMTAITAPATSTTDSPSLSSTASTPAT